MTLSELLAKNEATRKRREAERAASTKKERAAQAVQEESEKGTEVAETAPKKRGRKPANREYMVVEDVEHVNDDDADQVKV